MSYFNEATVDPASTDWTPQEQVYESLVFGIIFNISFTICSFVYDITPYSHIAFYNSRSHKLTVNVYF